MTTRKIAYRKSCFGSRETYECHQCGYMARGGDPQVFDWECELFDAYLGKYRAKRCDACVEKFGDKYLVKFYKGVKNEKAK